MKKWKMPLVCLFLTVLLLNMAACAPQEAEDPERKAAEALYAAAIAPISAAQDLVLTVASTQQRETAGGAVYSQKLSASIFYSGLGTESFQAVASQNLTCGTYENVYTEFYTGETAYCQYANTTFSGEMSAADFLNRQAPAVLLTPELYGSITATQSDTRTLLEFADGTALEDWAAGSEEAVFLSGSGTVTLDSAGKLLQSVYRTKYRVGTCVYDLTCTVKASPAQESGKTLSLPAIPENCVALSCFNAPRILMQATGDILSTDALTSHCREALSCQLVGISRTQQVFMNTCTQENSYQARVDYTADIVDGNGKPSQLQQTELFWGGKKTVSIGGSEPISQPEYSAAQMKKYCESTALSALFPASRLVQAELEQGDTLLMLRFQGSEDLADALCSSIYDNLQTGNLDNFAESYTSDGVQGYLTIYKDSRLPVACGISVGRTHIIEGSTYPLTYSMEQTLLLSSPTAYGTISPPAPVSTEAPTEPSA